MDIVGQETLWDRLWAEKMSNIHCVKQTLLTLPSSDFFVAHSLNADVCGWYHIPWPERSG